MHLIKIELSINKKNQRLKNQWQTRVQCILQVVFLPFFLHVITQFFPIAGKQSQSYLHIHQHCQLKHYLCHVFGCRVQDQQDQTQFFNMMFAKQIIDLPTAKQLPL